MEKYFLYFFLILLTIFFSFKLKEIYPYYRLLKEEVLKLEKQKNYLLKEKEMLEKELMVDKEKALEREARVMRGFKKEGEEVVLIIPSKENIFKEENNNTKNSSEQKQISFFKKFCYNLSKIKQIILNLIK
jgi:uncharacterized protein YpmB